MAELKIKNSSKKLRRLMESLDIQDLDDFISKAKIGDYAKLGKAYAKAAKGLADQVKNLVERPTLLKDRLVNYEELLLEGEESTIWGVPVKSLNLNDLIVAAVWFNKRWTDHIASNLPA